MASKKIVMAAGTFDLLHAGHIFYLQEAKRLGGRNSELWVIVARDHIAKSVKGRRPLLPERMRLAAVRGLRIVDRAILGDASGPLASIRRINPDIIVLGPTQPFSVEEVRREVAKCRLNCRVVRLRRRIRGVSSGRLAKELGLF